MQLKLLQGGIFGRDQVSSTGEKTKSEHFDTGLLDAYSATVIGAVERASPAVVGIRRRSQRSPGTEAIVDGAGSGVVITPDGYVLTNYHVAHGSRNFEVAFHDGITSPAELVGGDPDTDLALLRAARTGLTPGTLGDPLGLQTTVTRRHRQRGAPDAARRRRTADRGHRADRCPAQSRQ